MLTHVNLKFWVTDFIYYCKLLLLNNHLHMFANPCRRITLLVNKSELDNAPDGPKVYNIYILVYFSFSLPTSLNAIDIYITYRLF